MAPLEGRNCCDTDHLMHRCAWATDHAECFLQLALPGVLQVSSSSGWCRLQLLKSSIKHMLISTLAIATFNFGEGMVITAVRDFDRRIADRYA